MHNSWDRLRKATALTSLAILVGWGMYLSKTSLGAKFEEDYMRDVAVVDSIYQIRQDSLASWYTAKRDSLNEVYLTRKSVENLAR